MQRLILASVVTLGLMLLMVCVDAQARIAFVSNRDGNAEIYVMDADGDNQQNLTNNPASEPFTPHGHRMASALSLCLIGMSMLEMVYTVDPPMRST